MRLFFLRQLAKAVMNSAAGRSLTVKKVCSLSPNIVAIDIFNKLIFRLVQKLHFFYMKALPSQIEKVTQEIQAMLISPPLPLTTDIFDLNFSRLACEILTLAQIIIDNSEVDYKTAFEFKKAVNSIKTANKNRPLFEENSEQDDYGYAAGDLDQFIPSSPPPPPSQMNKGEYEWYIEQLENKQSDTDNFLQQMGRIRNYDSPQKADTCPLKVEVSVESMNTQTDLCWVNELQIINPESHISFSNIINELAQNRLIKGHFQSRLEEEKQKIEMEQQTNKNGEAGEQIELEGSKSNRNKSGPNAIKKKQRQSTQKTGSNPQSKKRTSQLSSHTNSDPKQTKVNRKVRDALKTDAADNIADLSEINDLNETNTDSTSKDAINRTKTKNKRFNSQESSDETPLLQINDQATNKRRLDQAQDEGGWGDGSHGNVSLRQKIQKSNLDKAKQIDGVIELQEIQRETAPKNLHTSLQSMHQKMGDKRKISEEQNEEQQKYRQKEGQLSKLTENLEEHSNQIDSDKKSGDVLGSPQYQAGLVRQSNNRNQLRQERQLNKSKASFNLKNSLAKFSSSRLKSLHSEKQNQPNALSKFRGNHLGLNQEKESNSIHIDFPNCESKTLRGRDIVVNKSRQTPDSHTLTQLPSIHKEGTHNEYSLAPADIKFQQQMRQLIKRNPKEALARMEARDKEMYENLGRQGSQNHLNSHKLREYINKMESLHRKICGKECIHLKRFYKYLKGQAWSKRIPMAMATRKIGFFD